MAREAFLTIGTGAKGVGKTYYIMHFIYKYIMDNFVSKVKGRKTLIFDTNGEYTTEQFARNGLKNVHIKKLAVSDVQKFAVSNVIEARRIDAKNLPIKQKLEVLKFVIQNFTNGLLVLEDINNYVLNITHMEEIVGVIVAARHRGLDIMISYQSLRPIEPRIWQNATWIRMHYQLDNVSDIKGKVPNPEILKIAQLIVNNRYYSGDKRFFVFIDQYGNRIEGHFTDEEFNEACIQYLNTNKKILKEYRDIHGLSSKPISKYGVTNLPGETQDAAYNGCIKMLRKRYLGEGEEKPEEIEQEQT